MISYLLLLSVTVTSTTPNYWLFFSLKIKSRCIFCFYFKKKNLFISQELESLVSKMQNEREKDLIIEARFHRQLIGPKGENIQKIRDEFEAVQISFPDLGSKSDVVKLRGPRDDVEKCGRTLSKMYKDLLENNYQVRVYDFLGLAFVSILFRYLESKQFKKAK